MKQLRNCILINILLAIILSSCNLPWGDAQERPTQTSKESMEQLFSYVPLEYVEEYSFGVFMPPIYYIDFEQMTKVLALPDLSSADSWSEKTKLIYGFQFQGGLFYPEALSFMNGMSYTTYGFDFTDMDQAMYLESKNTAIYRGIFDVELIDQKFSKMFTKEKVRDFYIYSGDYIRYYCYAVTEEIIIVGPDCGIVERMVLQAENPDNSALQNTHLQQLINRTNDPFGFALVHKAYFSDIYFEDSEILEKIPFLQEPNNYQYDWDMVMISNQGLEDISTLEVMYTFASEDMAAIYLPIVEETLTNTEMLGMLDYDIWSGVLDVEQVVQDANIVHATATTAEKNLVGLAFTTYDCYGFLPVKKIDKQ